MKRKKDANGNEKLLEEEQQQETETNQLIMTEDSIEIAHHLEHCKECQQGGIKGTKELLSLVGCNLYDEHEVQVQVEPSPAISM